MPALPTVAIAGATGNLGAKVTEGFLQPPFRDRFYDIIVLTRSRSPKVENLVKQGASLRLYAEDNLEEALAGVDVLINTYVYFSLTVTRPDTACCLNIV
jgi:nucleoside-diphosphate-sugar epimerase